MSLATRIFLGLFLGIAAGLFFGESMGFLDPVGDAFIGLLKMAVLPYIIVSLISGLGRLQPREAGTLFLRVGAILLLIWLLTFSLLPVVMLTFPDLQTASFFSTSLLEEPEPFDFLEFIPDNPFSSMAQNVVPAVVLFSIAVGVALMRIERKGPLIENLEILGEALTAVMHFVARLTPIGVFAIAASQAGTMRLEELGRLQVYVVGYVATTLIMTFCVLPALIAMLTPVRYRDVLDRTKGALVTAFATDSLLVVLPILATRGKELAQESGLSGEESDSAFDVIVPASFNFPNAGKLLQLIFVLFAAWFTGSAIPLGEYLQLMLTGLLAFFGKPVASMPFLLDEVRVPADMFQLYLASGIVAARFGTLVAVMQTFTLAVVGTFAAAGMLRLRFGAFFVGTAATALVVAAFAGGARLYFERALEGAYNKDQVIEQMQILDRGATARLLDAAPDVSGEDLSRPALERIRERGHLRVGHFEGGVIPFAFLNRHGELVGFDAAMAYSLADELGVGLEFVPVTRSRFAEALALGECDIAMTGIAVTPPRTEQSTFSEPYLDVTMAFIVKDHLREDFGSAEALRDLEAPRIAVLDVEHYIDLLEQMAPRAELVRIESPMDFFSDEDDRFDAFLYGAEMGSAYSLLYPEYSVAIPHPEVVRIPLAYAMPRGDPTLLRFVNTWVDLARKDGTIRSNYDYWILGKNAVERQPRWSVIRDVLGWVD